MSVERRGREDRWRQAQQELSDEGLPGDVVQELVARHGEAKPDPAIQAARQVVRETRQVVQEQAGLGEGWVTSSWLP